MYRLYTAERVRLLQFLPNPFWRVITRRRQKFSEKYNLNSLLQSLFWQENQFR